VKLKVLRKKLGKYGRLKFRQPVEQVIGMSAWGNAGHMEKSGVVGGRGVAEERGGGGNR